MIARGTVLAIDDDRGLLVVLRRAIESMGLACATAAGGREGLDRLESVAPDVVLVDLCMPDPDGLAVLAELRARDPELPVVMITGEGSLSRALHAVRGGAFEYVEKPLDLAILRRVLDAALAARAAAREDARALPGEDAPVVGRHPAMIELFKAIGAAAMPGNRCPVLVTGETGTGKGVVARALHAAGSAPGAPLVTFLCSGTPEALVDNELFGHERGAYTHATTREPGRIEAAGGGTLFLDEVGDLPLGVQGKLLRVLDTGEFERLGGTRTLRAPCRFVAATHRDLEARVHEGAFREDLLYRLAVVRIHVPALRERRSDVPLLLDHARARVGARLGRRVRLDDAARRLLVAYPWPGNVRELLHAVEQAAATCRGALVRAEHLPPSIREPSGTRAPGLSAARGEANAAFERDYVEQLLAESGGNVSEAARRAGVRRQYLQRVLRRHGLP